MTQYEAAKKRYAERGVDADAAINTLKSVPVSLHCWQGDDVRGFDGDPNAPLTGGIQTTGNYPGRARTPEELMADIDEVLRLCPGTKKLNLHASYAIFTEENGGWVDRDKLPEPGDAQILGGARQGVYPHFAISGGGARSAVHHEHLDGRRTERYSRRPHDAAHAV